MSKYLTKITEVYRVDTDTEVENLIEDAKNDTRFSVEKYNCVRKEKKSSGEIVDQYYKVQIVKSFNDEKDPNTIISVEYEVL